MTEAFSPLANPVIADLKGALEALAGEWRRRPPHPGLFVLCCDLVAWSRRRHPRGFIARFLWVPSFSAIAIRKSCRARPRNRRVEESLSQACGTDQHFGFDLPSPDVTVVVNAKQGSKAVAMIRKNVKSNPGSGD